MLWDPRYQACIPVLTTGPEPRTKVNVIELFRQADQLTAVYGQTPGETVAVIEWLLGLAHAAGVRPTSHEGWKDWVEERHSLEQVAEWLEQHPGCWNLFDRDEPLGQNAGLLGHLAQYGVGPAQLFLERAGDYNQHFDHHHLHHQAPVPADEAFRAMLTQHVYAIGMRARIKAKDMGLPAAFTNLATCRLAARIRVLAVMDRPDASVGDLIRLNLTPWERESDPDSQGFNLTWTQRPRRTFASAGIKEARTPRSPADLHSILGRSIALRPCPLPGGAVGVDRVLIAPGETLDVLPAAFVQDAVVDPQGRGFLKPSAQRELWREAHTLYAAVSDHDKDTDLYGRVAMLKKGHRVQLWAVGLLATRGKLNTWVSDHFPYIPGREGELRIAAEEGSSICEYVASALYRAAATAQEIAYPNPKPADKKAQIARFNAEREVWAGAGEPFHVLLEAVTRSTAPSFDALAVFAAEIRELAVVSLNARLDSLPSVGRGLQAKVRAQSRLQGLLDHPPHSARHLKEPAHA